MSTIQKKRSARRRPATREKLVRPRPVDAHVGARMRLRRTMLGMSQEHVAKALGLTFQQVQKYERGSNRVSASKLFDLSLIMAVPVQYFFDEMPDAIRETARTGDGAPLRDYAVVDKDPMAKRETLELVRAYFGIARTDLRRQVVSLARSLSGGAVGR